MTPSSLTIESVLDTNVLRYFLFVGRADLLSHILGNPLGVPRIVFDPGEEDSIPEDAMSEVRRSIVVQRRRSHDWTRDQAARSNASRNADRLTEIVDLHANGSIEILDMTHDERLVFSRLTTIEHTSAIGLNAILGMGEAVCVAVAVSRNLVLATDDGDALKALRKLRPKARHLRIRALLCEAANRELITRAEANALHREMRRLGLWDRTDPFPDAI
jgi:hypothetical protein